MNPQFHISKIFHDGVAVAGAAIASVTGNALNQWLQSLVLILTLIFLWLGIELRRRKLRDNTEED